MVNYLENDGLKIDKVVDLDPTSPLRKINDIADCIEKLDNECDVVITGYKSNKNPYFNMVEYSNDGVFVELSKSNCKSVVARQMAPAVYSMNASIYVWHRESLDKGLWTGKSKLHIMPYERSIDIDPPIDFLLVELLMEKRNELLHHC